MKTFGYLPEIVMWQLGLEWYWSWALMFGVIGIFILLFYYIKKKYGWPN